MRTPASSACLRKKVPSSSTLTFDDTPTAISLRGSISGVSRSTASMVRVSVAPGADSSASKVATSLTTSPCRR